MLNWHNKPWLKIISIALIIAFLTYDIAWATDFTPIQKKQHSKTEKLRAPMGFAADKKFLKDLKKRELLPRRFTDALNGTTSQEKLAILSPEEAVTPQSFTGPIIPLALPSPQRGAGARHAVTVTTVVSTVVTAVTGARVIFFNQQGANEPFSTAFLLSIIAVGIISIALLGFVLWHSKRAQEIDEAERFFQGEAYDSDSIMVPLDRGEIVKKAPFIIMTILAWIYFAAHLEMSHKFVWLLLIVSLGFYGGGVLSNIIEPLLSERMESRDFKSLRGANPADLFQLANAVVSYGIIGYFMGPVMNLEAFSAIALGIAVGLLFYRFHIYHHLIEVYFKAYTKFQYDPHSIAITDGQSMPLWLRPLHKIYDIAFYILWVFDILLPILAVITLISPADDIGGSIGVIAMALMSLSPNKGSLHGKGLEGLLTETGDIIIGGEVDNKLIKLQKVSTNDSKRVYRITFDGELAGEIIQDDTDYTVTVTFNVSKFCEGISTSSCPHCFVSKGVPLPVFKLLSTYCFGYNIIYQRGEDAVESLEHVEAILKKFVADENIITDEGRTFIKGRLISEDQIKPAFKNLKKDYVLQEDVENDIKLSILNGQAIGLDLSKIKNEADIDNLFKGELPGITANLIRVFTYDDDNAKENAREKLRQYFARFPDFNSKLDKLKSSLKQIYNLSKLSEKQSETLAKRRIVILLTREGSFATFGALAHSGSGSIYLHLNALNSIDEANLRLVLEHEDRDLTRGGHTDDIPPLEWQRLKSFWDNLRQALLSTTTEQILAVLSLYDTDGDGEIELVEMVGELDSDPKKWKFETVYLLYIFAKLDTGGNGRSSISELAGALVSAGAQADSNSLAITTWAKEAVDRFKITENLRKRRYPVKSAGYSTEEKYSLLQDITHFIQIVQKEAKLKIEGYAYLLEMLPVISEYVAKCVTNVSPQELGLMRYAGLSDRTKIGLRERRVSLRFEKFDKVDAVLKELLRFKPYPNTKDVRLKNLLLADWLKQTGFEILIDESGNVFASHTDDINKPHILFEIHSDVVRGGPKRRKKGDVIFGRGAVDNTGNIAAFINTVYSLREKGGLGNIMVIFDTEEENPSRDSLAKFIEKLERIGYLHPDKISGTYVIEPTNGQVAWASGGSCTMLLDEPSLVERKAKDMTRILRMFTLGYDGMQVGGFRQWGLMYGITSLLYSNPSKLDKEKKIYYIEINGLAMHSSESDLSKRAKSGIFRTVELADELVRNDCELIYMSSNPMIDNKIVSLNTLSSAGTIIIQTDLDGEKLSYLIKRFWKTEGKDLFWKMQKAETEQDEVSYERIKKEIGESKLAKFAFNTRVQPEVPIGVRKFPFEALTIENIAKIFSVPEDAVKLRDEGTRTHKGRKLSASHRPSVSDIKLAKQIQSMLNSVSGKNKGIFRMSAACNAGHFPPKYRPLIIGGGNGRNFSHTDEEQITIQELEEAKDIFLRLVNYHTDKNWQRTDFMVESLKNEIRNGKVFYLNTGSEELRVDSVEMLEKVVEFIAGNMPYVDMHEHLEGSISGELLLRLARKYIDEKYHEEAGQLVESGELFFKDEDLRDMAVYLDKFPLFQFVYSRLEQDKIKNFCEELAYEVVKDYARSGCRFLSLRFSPQAFAGTRAERYRDVLLGVNEGIDKAVEEAHSSIAVEKVVALVRHSGGVRWAKEHILNLLLELKNDGIYFSLDICGNEWEAPLEDFVNDEEFIGLLQKLGCNMTVHVGEVEIGSNIWALRKLRELLPGNIALRAGHGCSLQDELLRELASLNITVESCPTSNVQTGRFKDISAHPIFNWIGIGSIPVTLGLDNSRLGRASNAGQIIALMLQPENSSNSIALPDTKRLFLKGIESGFLDVKAKEGISKDFNERWGIFEGKFLKFVQGLQSSTKRSSPVDKAYTRNYKEQQVVVLSIDIDDSTSFVKGGDEYRLFPALDFIGRVIAKNVDETDYWRGYIDNSAGDGCLVALEGDTGVSLLQAIKICADIHRGLDTLNASTGADSKIKARFGIGFGAAQIKHISSGIDKRIIIRGPVIERAKKAQELVGVSAFKSGQLPLLIDAELMPVSIAKGYMDGNFTVFETEDGFLTIGQNAVDKAEDIHEFKEKIPAFNKNGFLIKSIISKPKFSAYGLAFCEEALALQVKIVREQGGTIYNLSSDSPGVLALFEDGKSAFSAAKEIMEKTNELMRKYKISPDVCFGVAVDKIDNNNGKNCFAYKIDEDYDIGGLAVHSVSRFTDLIKASRISGIFYPFEIAKKLKGSISLGRVHFKGDIIETIGCLPLDSKTKEYARSIFPAVGLTAGDSGIVQMPVVNAGNMEAVKGYPLKRIKLHSLPRFFLDLRGKSILGLQHILSGRIPGIDPFIAAALTRNDAQSIRRSITDTAL